MSVEEGRAKDYNSRKAGTKDEVGEAQEMGIEQEERMDVRSALEGGQHTRKTRTA